MRDTWLAYALAVAALRLVGALPLPLARRLGRWCGLLFYFWDRRHRAVCLENLAIAFPEKDRRERLAILKSSYAHLGQCAADFCHFDKVKPEELRGGWIVLEEGTDGLMRNALAQKCGLICVSAHIGFWELGGFAYPALGYPLVSVSRRIPGPRLEALANRMRTRLGNVVVHKEGALRPLLRALHDNQCIGVIMDQRAGRAGPWVQFFTRPASTVDTCARLHLKTGAPLLSSLMIRRADGRYTWRCRPIHVPPLEGRSPDERVIIILRAIHCDLEEAIRETPEQWLWMYKRWKGSDGVKLEIRNPKEKPKEQTATLARVAVACLSQDYSPQSL